MKIPAKIGRALIYPLIGSAFLPEEKVMYGASLAIMTVIILGGAGWVIYKFS